MAEKSLESRTRNVIRQANEWAGRPGNSIARLGQAAGMSSATLSPFMRGVYTGSNENVVVKLEGFFDLERERAAIDIDAEFIRTRQTAKIEQFIKLAHAYRNICVIVGDSGLGKTTTLMEYSQRPNVFYIKCHPLMRGAAKFIKSVGLALDIPAGGDQLVLYNRVVAVIQQSNPLLIFDDAQALNSSRGLNTTVFEIIRDLHDRGAGVVIAGNNQVRESVTNTAEETFYQQLAARSNILQVDSRFRREDIEAVVNGLIKGRLRADEYDYLYEVAHKFYGSLHLVRRILILAVTRGKAKGIGMSRALLEDAARHFVSQLKPAYRKKQGAQLNVPQPKKTPDPDSQRVDAKETPAQAQSA